MSTAADFLKALRIAGDDQSVEAYWARERDEWVTDLNDLRASIAGWLQPVVEAGLAKIRDIDFPIIEPDVGSYVAPGSEIELMGGGAKTILVRPRGVRIVGAIAIGDAAANSGLQGRGRLWSDAHRRHWRVDGARGRVDLECGVAREILLRFKNGDAPVRWSSFSHGEEKELGEGVFFDLLAQVAGLPLPEGGQRRMTRKEALALLDRLARGGDPSFDPVQDLYDGRSRLDRSIS